MFRFLAIVLLGILANLVASLHNLSSLSIGSDYYELPLRSHAGFKSPYSNLHDVCEREEFSIWRITENNCMKINNATSLKAWDIDAFSFFENVQTHEIKNGLNEPMLLVAFDIIGPAGSFGNWWRVMLQNATDGLSIQVAGRVVDHWNGKYTVYLHLPVAGDYIMDVLLEYIACQGYPDDFARHPVEVLYHGSYKRVSIKWQVHQPALHKTTALRVRKATRELAIFRYLADTGYYRDDIWRPAAMTYACYPQMKLPREATSILFEGDSTVRRQLECGTLKKKECQLLALNWNDQAANRSREMFARIAASPGTVRNVTWTAKMASFAVIPYITEPTVVLENAGVHLMNETWETQKRLLRVLAEEMSLLPNIATNATDSNNKVSLIWRDTWSMHEYCFVPNPYWKEIVWKGENVPSYLGKEFLELYATFLYTMRDPVSHMQRSYTLDVIVRGTNKTHWLPSYFLSKAAIKRKLDHDMRHHDVRVNTALWRSIIDMYDM